MFIWPIFSSSVRRSRRRATRSSSGLDASSQGRCAGAGPPASADAAAAISAQHSVADRRSPRGMRIACSETRAYAFLRRPRLDGGCKLPLPCPTSPRAPARAREPAPTGSCRRWCRSRWRPSRPAAAEWAALFPSWTARVYEVEGEFAHGAMGRILLAHDRRLGAPRRAEGAAAAGRGAATARFVREALLTARLQHPGIVPDLRGGRWPDGEPFYAMKLVAGRSLDRTSSPRRTTLAGPPRAAAPRASPSPRRSPTRTASGVIHRDLKPANVLVGEFGETVVIDWGLAKDLRSDAARRRRPAAPMPERRPHRATVAGSVLGTPQYMPPEQARGEPSTSARTSTRSARCSTCCSRARRRARAPRSTRCSRRLRRAPRRRWSPCSPSARPTSSRSSRRRRPSSRGTATRRGRAGRWTCAAS